MFVKLSLFILAVAIIYRIAPGDPAWMTEIPPHVPPNEPYNTVHTFPGGDGTTQLTGRFFPAVNSTTLTTKPTTPIIILAHGIALSQDSSLDSFVTAFHRAGFAAFTFDYATFGYSQGWPRHQVNPERHVADLKAAISYVRTNLAIDPITTPLALWGTSMGGAHVLRVAADDAESHSNYLTAVVAFVPHIKSATESILGCWKRDPFSTTLALTKVLGALVKWSLSQLFYGETTYIPVSGPPGSVALMQNPGDNQGYNSLNTPRATAAGWTNRVSVGSILPIMLYRPFNTIHQIQVPTLLLPAQRDTLCPAVHAEQALARISKGKLILLNDLGHFDVYSGPALELVLNETIVFFQEHLLDRTSTSVGTVLEQS